MVTGRLLKPSGANPAAMAPDETKMTRWPCSWASTISFSRRSMFGRSSAAVPARRLLLPALTTMVCLFISRVVVAR